MAGLLVWDVVRSSDSRDSIVDMVGAREGVSLDLRDSGGDCVSSSLSLSLDSSLDLPLKSIVKEGAAGLSLGVDGRCEEAGRVPIGAWSGLLSRLVSMISSSPTGMERLDVEPPYPTEGLRE